jgi:RHS repeat-associated protein
MTRISNWALWLATLCMVLACGNTTEGEGLTDIDTNVEALTPTGSVLSFEAVSDWSTNKGQLAPSSTRVHGAASLAVSNGGDATISSIPIGSIAPVGTELTIDVLQPVNHPNPYWYGTVKVVLVAPSLNMWWQELPEQSLSGRPLGEFTRFTLPIPTSARNALSNNVYSDLTIKVLLNVPLGQGPWLLDRLSFGTVEDDSPPDDGPGDDGADDAADDAADDSTTDDSQIDASADESTTDESTTDESTTDESTTDESTTDESTTDESTTDESTSDDDPDPDPGPGTTLEFFVKLPAGVDRESVMFGTYGGDLRLNDGAQVVTSSGWSSSANISAIAGGRVSRLGMESQSLNVWSDGLVEVTGSARVLGDIRSAGAVSIDGNPEIGGGIYEYQTIGPWQEITWDGFFPDATNGPIQTEPDDPPVAPAPGAYDALLIKPRSEVALSAGTYTFDSIMINAEGELSIDNSDGPVFIYSKNGLTHHGVVTREAENPNILFSIAGMSEVHLAGPFRGTIVAPWTKVNLFTILGKHTGSIFAKSAEAHQWTQYVHEPFSPDWLCGVGAECSSFCACGENESPCESDAECAGKLECDEESSTCVCEPVCEGKQCGDDSDDGCGGVCPGLCEDGESGCILDAECAVGSVCAEGAGPQKGHPEGTNVCLAAVCLAMDPSEPNCGVGDADCGPCLPCEPQCDGRCGGDGCGGECPPPPDGEFCGVKGYQVRYDPSEDHDEDFPAALGVVEDEGAPVGTLPGKFWVSDRGTSNYRIPIETPPGRGGIRPNLAFAYTSTKANGLMGMGWKLDGLSSIARCPKIQARGVEAEPVRLNAADEFCMDGQRLVPVEITDLPPGMDDEVVRELRTEVESFSRIFMRGSIGNPTGFQVWRRDGQVYTYGELADREESANSIVLSGGVGRVWGLSQVEDRAGNSMLVEYHLRNNLLDIAYADAAANSSELLPERISFGGTVSSQAHDRSVEFRYESRPDSRQHYVLGERTDSKFRLKYATVSANGEPTRSYTVEYPAVGESVVQSIQLCAPDSDGACLPPTTFEYDSDVGFEPETEIEVVGWEQEQRIDQATQAMDMNGDGIADFVRRLSPEGPGIISADYRVLVSHREADGGVGYTVVDIPFLNLPFNVLDIDGDGMDDIVKFPRSDGCADPVIFSSRRCPWTDGPGTLLASTGTSFEASSLPAGMRPDQPDESLLWSLYPVVGDLNGDGVKDAVSAFDFSIIWGDGMRFGATTGYPMSPETKKAGKHYAALDLDGDGDDDLIRPEFGFFGFESATGWYPLFRLVNPAQAAPYWGSLGKWPHGGYVAHWPSSTLVRDLGQRLDVNGDGLVDLLRTTSSAIQVWVSSGEGFNLANPGVFDEATLTAVRKQQLVLDYNGDGRDDLLVPELGAVLLANGANTFDNVEDAFEPLDDYDALVADVDGDGAKDLVHFGPGTQIGPARVLYRRSRAGSVGLLKQVTDGFGKTISVDYDALQPDHSGFGLRATYARGTRTATNDVARQLTNVTPLVSGHQEAQAGGERHEYAYRYEDAEVGLGGRGWLGFGRRWITELVPGTPMPITETRLEFINNDYRMAGFVSSSTRTRLADRNGQVFARKTAITNSWSMKESANFREFPWLNNKTTIVSEVTGGYPTELHYVRTERDPDGYGNVIQGSTRTCRSSACGSDQISFDAMQMNPAQIEGFWLKFSPGRTDVRSHIGPDWNAFVARVHEFSYYPNGLLAGATREPSAASEEGSERSAYQRTELARSAPFWNVDSVSVFDADDNSRTTDIAYDARGLFPVRVSKEVDGVNHTTEMQLSDATGETLTQRDANGVVVQYAYDLLGRLREEQTDVSVTRMNYLAFGEPGCPARSTGVMCRTTASYDRPASPEATLADAQNGFRTVLVDGFGRVIQERSSGLLGAIVQQEYDYDERGRLQMASLPHDAQSADDQGAVVYEYDELDRLISTMTPDGRLTTYDYFTRATAGGNEFQLLDSVRAMEAVVSHQPDDSREIAVHDASGRPVKTVQEGASEPFGTGATNSYQYGYFNQLDTMSGEDDFSAYEYDELGRVLLTHSRARGIRTYEYSGFDEVVTERDAFGSPSTYCHTYDEMGRLRSRARGIDGTCDGAQSPLASWVYDIRAECEPGDTACEQGEERLLGKLVESSRVVEPDAPDELTRTTYHYETDPSVPGRLSATRRYLPGLADPLTTSYSYEQVRLKGVDYPSSDGEGFGVRYEYDSNGSVRFVLKEGGGVLWRVLAADHGLRVASEVFGDDSETSYEYYSTQNTGSCSAENCMPGALASITTTMNAAPIDTTNYQYDAPGNVAFRRRVQAGSGAVTSEDQYTYDGYQRLEAHAQTIDSGAPSNSVFTYTKGGNLLAVSGDAVADTYDYGSTGGPTLKAFNGRTVVHNANGNLVSREDESGNDLSYEYNDLELARLVTVNGAATQLEYNAEGARTAKRGPTQTTLYAGDLYECVDSSGPESGDPVLCDEHRYKVYVGSRLVAQTTRKTGEADRTDYIHSDALGSATLLTNEDGEMSRRSFEPFGRPEQHSTNSSVLAGFTGHDHDTELGLINMKGRLYDPELRRFTTADPFVTEPLNPQGLNRYAYVNNNPLNYTDPSGFQSRGPDSGGGQPMPPGSEDTLGTGPYQSSPRTGDSQTDAGLRTIHMFTAHDEMAASTAAGYAGGHEQSGLGTRDSRSIPSGGGGGGYGPSESSTTGGGPEGSRGSDPGGSGAGANPDVHPSPGSGGTQAAGVQGTPGGGGAGGRTFAQMVIYGDYSGSGLLQTAQGDRALQNAQEASLAGALLALSIANGSLALQAARAALANAATLANLLRVIGPVSGVGLGGRAGALAKNSVIEGFKLSNHAFRKGVLGRGATEEIISGAIRGAREAGTVTTEVATGKFAGNTIEVFVHNGAKVVTDSTRGVIVSIQNLSGFHF